MAKEIWKDVPGYSGYQASNQGNIRSNRRVPQADKKNPNSWISLIPFSRAGKGYLAVDVWMDEETRKTEFIHQLVARAWLDPVKGATSVNHKDKNRENNTVGNLQWMTVEENTSIAQKA